MYICQRCRLIHSDRISCERAKYTGEFNEPMPSIAAEVEVIPMVPVSMPVSPSDTPAKPVFDKYAHLAKARAARKAKHG